MRCFKKRWTFLHGLLLVALILMQSFKMLEVSGKQSGTNGDVSFFLASSKSRSHHDPDDITPCSARETSHRDGVDKNLRRKYYFMGNSINRHYSYALERLLNQQRDVEGERSKEKADCPKDTLGCDRGRVKFLWKNWPLVPRSAPSMPPEHLLDGCKEYGEDVEACYKAYFAEATDDDVLIIGSNYAFTSICLFATEEEAFSTAEKDIPASITLLRRLFPGLILYHSLGPVRPDHPRPAEHKWIPTINKITEKALKDTNILYVDTYSYLQDKTSQYEDVIHHPGAPSEGIVQMFLGVVTNVYVGKGAGCE